MLPVPVLDDEEFDTIMEEARSLIAGWYPQWTDFNYHDPGITLLEMFSWLKESQQYHLDQISDEARKKYLKLLGIRPETQKAARAVVRVEPDGDASVLAGTRLLAGCLSFEAEEKKQLMEGGILRCLTWDKKEIQFPESSPRMGIYPFGTYPIMGNCFYIQPNSRPPAGQKLNLWLEIAPLFGQRRNPVKGKIPFPLARLWVQYYHGGAWRDAGDVKDGTFGCLFSGFVDFVISDEMDGKGPACLEEDGREGYFLRLLLLEAEYDAPPVLDGISLNALWVRQRRTILEQLFLPLERQENGEIVCRAETMAALNGRNDLFLYLGEDGAGRCVHLDRFEKSCNYDTGESSFRFLLPEEGIGAGARTILALSFELEDEGRRIAARGNGFPCQQYDTGFADLEYGTFSLMIREDKSQMWFIWEKVMDFSCSGPEDRHYILDHETGKIRFGDCAHGMAPRGEILVTACSTTAGGGGNVKTGAIDRFEGLKPEEIPVWNPLPASGGRFAESLDQCFIRVKRMLRTPETAVSSADYEKRVLETPGLLIESCRVIRPETPELRKKRLAGNEIFIVVRPYSESGAAALSDSYRRNILAYLENFRQAGVELRLLSAQYVLFDIYGELTARAEYRDAELLVKRAAEEYFDNLKNRFGAVVSYSGLYGRLDQLDCVGRIRTLTMEARDGRTVKGRDGSIHLPANGLARLGEARFALSED